MLIAVFTTFAVSRKEPLGDVGAGQPTSPGINVKDSWWVNGRQRFMGALRVVDADPAAKKLPTLPEKVASLFASCGKVRRTMQVPLAVAAPKIEATRQAPTGVLATPTGEAIQSVVRAYRARMPELLEALPHDLPPRAERVPVSPTSGLPLYGFSLPDGRVNRRPDRARS